jgi:hypothetical protein
LCNRKLSQIAKRIEFEYGQTIGFVGSEEIISVSIDKSENLVKSTRNASHYFTNESPANDWNRKITTYNKLSLTEKLKDVAIGCQGFSSIVLYHPNGATNGAIQA